MQALEFQTTLHNGTVTLPPEYSSQWEGKTIRVILLDEAAPTSAETPDSGSPEPIAASSIFSRLKQIKISAPPDFSENIDAYLNGEKHV
jgi:hypothetical protein